MNKSLLRFSARFSEWEIFVYGPSLPSLAGTAKLCAAILLGLCVAITYNHVYVVSIVLNYHACTSPGHCTSLAKNTGFHSGIHIHSVSWLAAELSCIVDSPTANCNRGLAVACSIIVLRQRVTIDRKIYHQCVFLLCQKNTNIIFILNILSINGIL